jgi:hypothetical protein
MNGHMNNDIEGEGILWADASLEGVDAGYENFSIRIREEGGGRKVVRCLGYIGFQMVGFWDEVIIETARVVSSHLFIGDCERRLRSLPETGAKGRKATANRLLEVVLIDGCKLWVCARQFRCDQSL